MEMPDGTPILLSNTPIVLVEKGEADVVLAEARDFASALPEERLIARLFWGDIEPLAGSPAATRTGRGRRRDRHDAAGTPAQAGAGLQCRSDRAARP